MRLFGGLTLAFYVLLSSACAPQSEADEQQRAISIKDGQAGWVVGIPAKVAGVSDATCFYNGQMEWTGKDAPPLEVLLKNSDRTRMKPVSRGQVENGPIFRAVAANGLLTLGGTASCVTAIGSAIMTGGATVPLVPALGCAFLVGATGTGNGPIRSLQTSARAGEVMHDTMAQKGGTAMVKSEVVTSLIRAIREGRELASSPCPKTRR